jgi:light-regulated signal transduction histidine kinase (bacteriophytochrome)
MRRRAERERKARQEAEAIAERTIGRLYAKEAELREHRDHLEDLVAERTAALRVANDELEAFCYSVSHDLRAPLRGMDGFSQALLEECEAKLEGEQQDYLRRIRAASQRMAQLIDDLLTLSQVSRSEMRRRSVDISALAESIASGLCVQDPGRRVAFRIEPGLTARADEALLQVVLENLLGNAWKFTSHQERATIECGMSDQSTYFVRDDGAGFDMAYAGKLFGAFQRLHSAAEFEGTGVGLATVQRIVHRHGGRVWAEGEVGGGAAFHFTLIPEGEHR